MANVVCMFKSEKGKNCISFDGFSYRFAKRGVDGTIYWRCLDDRSCRGRISTDNDNSNPGNLSQ
jgi:hypothetical protein